MSVALSDREVKRQLAQLCLVETSSNDKRKPFRWDAYALLLQPDLAKVVHDRVAAIAQCLIAQSDYLCVIPNGGWPLGIQLHLSQNKPLIRIEEKGGLQPRGKVAPGAGIVFVDSVIHTGGTLEHAIEQLDRIEGSFLGAVIIALDDLHDPSYCEVRDKYLREGMIKFVYRFSELKSAKQLSP